MRPVLASLGIEKLAGDGHVALRSPRMSAAARLFADPEALGRNVAVGDGAFELGGGFLILTGGELQVILCHRSGSSFGHGISTSSGNRA